MATDNGNPVSMVPFHIAERRVFSGQVLAIVQAEKEKQAVKTDTAESP